MKRYRRALLLLSAVLGVFIALMGALAALETTRTVDVVSIFAGSFGAGAALVSALYERKRNGPRDANAS